jgi:nucleotide-binding universal stress UspA family protein
MTTFLVGLDGSSESMGALATAVRLGMPIEAELVLAFVRHTPSTLAGSPEALSAHGLALDAIADDIHNAATAQLKEYPGSWELVQRSGDPTTELIAAARIHGADLIVVGHRGHSELVDLMLGSVASRLVHHSSIAMLVAKSGSSFAA